MRNNGDEPHADEAVHLAIDGVLDLHTFDPREIKNLIPDYLQECARTGIYSVRIIHGKGSGSLREAVHSILRRLPQVASFRLAGPESGSWGATIVELFREL